MDNNYEFPPTNGYKHCDKILDTVNALSTESDEASFEVWYVWYGYEQKRIKHAYAMSAGRNQNNQNTNQNKRKRYTNPNLIEGREKTNEQQLKESSQQWQEQEQLIKQEQS